MRTALSDADLDQNRSAAGAGLILAVEDLQFLLVAAASVFQIGEIQKGRAPQSNRLGEYFLCFISAYTQLLEVSLLI